MATCDRTGDYAFSGDVLGNVMMNAYDKLSNIDPKKVGFLHTAVLNGQCDAISHIIKQGCDVNEIYDGMTPLMCACTVKNMQNVQMLLSNGADPLIENDKGEIIMDYVLKPVCMSRDPNRVFIDLSCSLIKYIPDEELVRFDNQYKHLIDWLLRSNEAKDFTFLMEFLDRGVNVNAHIEDNSLLHIAVCVNTQYKCVKLLLDHGADVNAINDRFETPLHRCVQVIDIRTRCPVVNLLLERGAILHTVNRHGDSLFVSALFNNIGYSIANDRLDLLIALPIHGCDLWQNDRLNSTLRMFIWPMDFALRVYVTALKAGFDAYKLGHCNSLCDLITYKIGSIDSEHYNYIKFYLDNPVKPLQLLCNTYIRRYLAVICNGTSIVNSIKLLSIPRLLKEYMMLN